jgi:hypothetical protein
MIAPRVSSSEPSLALAWRTSSAMPCESSATSDVIVARFGWRIIEGQSSAAGDVCAATLAQRPPHEAASTGSLGRG